MGEGVKGTCQRRPGPPGPRAAVGRGPGRPNAEAAAVAFDARYITAQPSGIGHMCLELLRGLADREDRPPLMVLVNRQTCLPAELRARENLDYCEAPWRPMSLLNQLLLPRLLRRYGVQLLHSVDAYNPLAAFGVRMIVNIHDLIPLTCDWHDTRSRKARYRCFWKRWLRWQCARAHTIVAVSQFSAGQVVRLLGVRPEKVRVILNPVREWAEVEPEEGIRQRLQLPGRIISYVGRHEPYKNIVSLVQAMRILVDTEGDRQMKLVLAGSIDVRYPDARQEVTRLGLSEQVLFTGYLDDATLGALYRASDVFVFPSLYEGFGLPPLEAMRFGTPVIAGRHTALPEVLGDAALYVDTKSPHSIAQGIMGMLKNPAVAGRLRAAGTERVKHYSRQQTVRQYLELYKELLAERSGGA